MRRWVLSVTILGAMLWSPHLRAEPLPIDACVQQALTQTHVLQSDPALAAQADALFLESMGDAYRLSMPLMVAGYLGERGLYTVVSAYMNKAFNINEDNTFNDWLSGRILLADDAMNGKITRTDVLITLQRHVDRRHANDNFSTWAVGYLAAVDYAYKDKMLKAAHELTANPDVATSDKVWAWVLVQQAAANGQDMETYLAAMDHINRLAGQTHLGKSLQSSLLRTENNSDYPAWAIAMARLSSATMGDKVYFHALEKSMNESLEAAKRDAEKDYKARAEKLLAEVNNRLAIERHQALKDCNSGSR